MCPLVLFPVTLSDFYRRFQGHGDALHELCAQLTRDLFAIAKFLLYVARLVPANACQRTKFQLSSSISFGDMRGAPKYKVGAFDFLRRPLAGKFLYRALVLVNAYKYVKFQLPSSINYGDMEGVPK